MRTDFTNFIEFHKSGTFKFKIVFIDEDDL
jgi:hypothetical protein